MAYDINLSLWNSPHIRTYTVKGKHRIFVFTEPEASYVWRIVGDAVIEHPQKHDMSIFIQLTEEGSVDFKTTFNGTLIGADWDANFGKLRVRIQECDT